MPDKDGYPTKSELSRIKHWSYKDPLGLINYIRSLWWRGDMGLILRNGRDPFTRRSITKLDLHTWGWSGNEDIIRALKESEFWLLWWEASVRGGHYYFQIRKLKT